jgi:pantetheine-phosphate adenylyltransferase
MEMMKKIAVYPGSFDPITNGHIDILKRALEIFDEVILLLAIHPQKTATFSVDERLNMLGEVVKTINPTRLRVDVTSGLTVRYAKDNNAKALIRGLRAVPDFNYEHEIFSGNYFIDPSIEMVFFMANPTLEFISSSTLKQLAHQGVNIDKLAPKVVVEYLKKLT